MSRRDAITAGVSVRRVDLYGSLHFLIGLLFVVEHTVDVLDTGVSLAELGGLAFGLIVIGAGAFVQYRPERAPGGTEPAPRQLFVIAGVTTLAFFSAILMTVL